MASPRRVPLLIDGQWVRSESDRCTPVIDPATQEVLSEVPQATEAELARAVASAQAAFQTWKEVPVPQRARLMLNYQHLLKQHHDELAEIISRELGKTFEDAKGDVWRGIEVVEHAANIAGLLMGETVENVASGIDTCSWHQPLGVCLGITPFNFPAMIPLWMFPLAIACGNTFVLKPSERDPLTPTRLAELFIEAGAPAGVLQVVHGGAAQVDYLLEHPDIRAGSFVGSVAVGKHIYRKGTEHLKRMQCMTGANNHMVVMPDANRGQVVNKLVGSAFGAAGQRCMAIPNVILVGAAQEWIPEIVEATRNIRPGVWSDAGAAYGPLTTPVARDRVREMIAQAKADGATCLLDGSDCQVEGYPDGNWLGPTIFTDLEPEMPFYCEEVFGPVLCILKADSLEEAITLINRDFRGNGTSLFTASGAAARKFQHEIQVGQVGINVPIPVPLPFFSFTGWRGSFHGDLHAYGKQAVRFYTETKTVISRWFEGDIPSGPNMSINLR